MLDKIIVVCYLIVLLFIGIYHKSKNFSLISYGTVDSKEKNNRILLMATIFSTAVGGGTIFGLTEKVFIADLSYTYALVIAAISDILLGIFVVPRIVLKHYGSISVGDIMSKYYGKTGRIIVGFSAALTSFGYIAAQINATGRIFEYLLGVSFIEGVILSYLVCIIYTATGGLKSLMFTNFIQFIAMILAVPLIMILGIYKVGITEFISFVPEYKYSFSSNAESSMWLALGFCVMGFYPSFIQRALIANKRKNIRDAILLKSFIYILFIGVISINGLLALQIVPDTESIMIIPDMIQSLVPTGIKGLVVIGLLSAVMSTADSDLNVASITIVNDIVRPIFNIHHQKILLLFSQIVTVVVGTSAIYIALCFNNILDLIFFVAGFWAPVCFVPMIFALFNVTIPKFLFILSAIIGLLTFSMWECYLGIDFKIKGVFIGTAANLICFIFSYVFCRIFKFRYTKN